MAVIYSVIYIYLLNVELPIILDLVLMEVSSLLFFLFGLGRGIVAGPDRLVV
jgi:hypothetical protein